MRKAEVRPDLRILLSWICIFDSALSQDQTWITVNNAKVSSYTASFTDTALDILCNTALSDSTATITSQYLLKAQNFTYDPLDGSGPSPSMSGWSTVCYPRSLWQVPGLTCLSSSQTTQQSMSSGVRITDLSPFASGLYKCSTNYRTQSNAQLEMISTVVSINANGPVAASLSVFVQNSYGSQSQLSSTSDTIDVSQYNETSVVCYITSSNEVPQYQMFVNDEDVTFAVNTSGSYGSLAYLSGLNDSRAFSSITYQIKATYKLSVSGPCSNWTVTCASVVLSDLDRPTTTAAFLASPFCSLPGGGSYLRNPFNKASDSSMSSVSLIALSWGLVCTLSIKL